MGVLLGHPSPSPLLLLSPAWSSASSELAERRLEEAGRTSSSLPAAGLLDGNSTPGKVPAAEPADTSPTSTGLEIAGARAAQKAAAGWRRPKEGISEAPCHETAGENPEWLLGPGWKSRNQFCLCVPTTHMDLAHTALGQQSAEEVLHGRPQWPVWAEMLGLMREDQL